MEYNRKIWNIIEKILNIKVKLKIEKLWNKTYG